MTSVLDAQIRDFTGSSASICRNNTFTLSMRSTQPIRYKFIFSIDNGASWRDLSNLLSDANANTWYYATPTLQVNTIFKLVYTTDLSDGSVPNIIYGNQVSVTVNPLPAVSPLTYSTDVVCQNSDITYVSSTPNGVWASDDVTKATVNASGVVHGVSAGQAYISYTVTDANTGCSNMEGALVTVSPTPMISNIVDAVCSGIPYTKNPSLIAGNFVPANTTYDWSLPNTSAVGLTGTSSGSSQANINALLTNTTNSAITATYTITATKGACVSVPFTLALSVTPAPLIANRTLPNVCSGTAFSDAPSNGNGDIVPTGITYSWTRPSVPAGITNQAASGTPTPTSFNGLLNNSTNGTITVTYNVTTYNAGCQGSTFTETVVVNPTPTISAKSATICSNANFNITIPTGMDIVPVGTTYTWSAPVVSGVGGLQSGTNLSSVTGTLSNTTNAPIDVTYIISPTAGSCTGANFNTVITINPVPIISDIGPTQTGSGSSFNFSIGGSVVPAGTTYSWLAPVMPVGLTGGVASGTPSPTSLTGTLTNPTGAYLDATYTITPTFRSCSGNTFTYIVRVYPKPIIGLKQTAICSGGSFSFIPQDGNPFGEVVPAGTTYSWDAPVVTGITGTVTGTTQNSISGTLYNSTNSPIIVEYSVIPLANPQAGDAFFVRVTVNPLPQASIIVTDNSGTNQNDLIICSNEVATFTASPTVTANYEYTWAVPNGATPQDLTVSNFTSNIAGTYGLRIKNISTTCISATQTTTSITVLAPPNAGDITGPNNVCVNSSITLSSHPSGGSGPYRYFYWYDNNVLVGPPLSSVSVIVTGNVASDAQVTYKVQDNQGCYSSMSNVFILHINPLPLQPIITSIDQPYDGLLHTGTALPTNPATEQIDWYQLSTGATTSVAPFATNYTPTPVASYALARNTNTGCISDRVRVTVNISKKDLTLTANDDQKIYNGAAYTTGNGVTPNPGGFVNGETIAVLSGTLSYTFSPQNPINAGTYTIMPNGLTSSNYNINFVFGTLTINKKVLTITGASVLDKVYDATDNANMNAGVLFGLIPADASNVTLNRIAKFPSKNVGTSLIITSYSTISGTGASNYILDPAVTITASILEKHIDVTGVLTSDKVYDGTLIANVSGGGFRTAIAAGTGTSTDKLPYNGDDIQLVPAGVFINKDVANNVTITSTSSIAGIDKNNYILDQPILTPRNITPKTLNMSGLYIATPKVYDGTTTAFVSGSPSLLSAESIGTGTVNDGKPYTVDQVSISGSVNGVYNSKDVATANAVSFSGLSLTGANANNYTLTIQSAYTSSISPKALSMFGLSVPASKVYDGNTNSVVNGSPSLLNAVSTIAGNILDGKPYINDNVNITGTPAGNYNSKDVATAAYVKYSGLYLIGTHASNYSLTMQGNDPSRITPLPLNVNANSQLKLYGDADPIFTYANDPLIGDDVFSGTLDRVVGENVGTYQIQQGSLTLGPNYTISYTPNNLTIIPASLVIKPNAVVRTYGDAPLPTTLSSTDFQATGLKYNETLGSITLTLPTGAGTGNEIKDTAGKYINVVGTSDPTPGTVDLNNYQVTLLPGDIVVKKYDIIITAEPKEKRKNQIDPPFTYLVSRALVQGDTLSGSLTRVPGEEVGFYSILQGTVYINDNYAIKYIPADLEILTIERVVVVPNAFTPNNDGLNDVIKAIHNSTIVSFNYFKIFDRSGKQIFETRNINDGWDGKLNGAVAESDAYYWVIEYNTWDNKVYQTKGSFVLIK